MIFITGDTHSDFHRFSTSIFPEQREMTREDYVIICGDFGGVWYQENAKEINKENYWLDWLEQKPFTTLFVDGNHENFTRLYRYPIKTFCGGLVHEIRPHVLHLMRGEIFNLQGYTFFAFGGAGSHDIQDGILNADETAKIKLWNKQGKMFRVRDISWWDMELPTTKEMQRGLDSLEDVGFDVDFVVSHCAPQNIVSLVSQESLKPDRLTLYFDELLEKGLCFHAWFHGHYHDNRKTLGKYCMLYEQIIRIV